MGGKRRTRLKHRELVCGGGGGVACDSRAPMKPLITLAGLRPYSHPLFIKFRGFEGKNGLIPFHTLFDVF